MPPAKARGSSSCSLHAHNSYKRQSSRAKRYGPKAFQETRWIGNTDALLAPTCGTSPARGRLTLLGTGLIDVPAKVQAGTHCRSALELLHSTKALPVQLDQPSPLEETQLLSTKETLVPAKLNPPPPAKPDILWAGGRGFKRQNAAIRAGFHRPPTLLERGLQLLLLAGDCGLHLL